MILIRFNFLQVFPPAPTFVFATSFRGFSPTRPTERDRGRVGEILGNEVVETANLVPRVLSYPPYPTLSLSRSVGWVGENPGNEVVK